MLLWLEYRGDAATASTIATSAPTVAATTASARPRATSCLWSIPRLRSAGFSLAARNSSREKIWPITNRALTAVSRENRARAVAWGRMACSTAAASWFSSAMYSGASAPPVSGNWWAKLCACLAKAARDAPGRSRT